MARALMLLLVLTAALTGAGYWNYQRNAALDRELQQPRPYRTLSTAQLRELVDAYRGESKRLDRRLSQTSTGEGAMGRHQAADFAGRVESFDRFQQQNREWRELRGSGFETQSAIADLERELRIRETGLDQPSRRIWRRLSTF